MHQNKTSSVVKYTFWFIFGSFAVIGMVFSAVFISMQYGILNVRGLNSDRNEFFEVLPKNAIQFASLSQSETATSCLAESEDGTLIPVCAWNESKEWEVVRGGLLKDKDVILKVAEQTGISPRMITAAVVPEQLRFFTSERESYKKYFEPLKILGSMSQFSLGVSGIKQKTAERIEQYLVDSNSPFYPGGGFLELIEYSSQADKSGQLYNRLTDDDHYYSYLYSALFLREVQAQWEKEGYDVSDRPDVLVTLFNLGFDASDPKPTPQMGGSAIWLNGEVYNFGELGTAFYLSDELNTIFERQKIRPSFL